MILSAFVFGFLILVVSLFFLLFYVRSHNHIRDNHTALARRRAQQLKFQAELQAQIDADARKYEEARQALLKQTARGGGDTNNRNIGHAA
jgi:thiosulfate reductase cytochrome b subunit